MGVNLRGRDGDAAVEEKIRTTATEKVRVTRRHGSKDDNDGGGGGGDGRRWRSGHWG